MQYKLLEMVLVATWVIEEGSYRRHADEEARISNLASDKVNLNQGNCFTPDCPHQYL